MNFRISLIIAFVIACLGSVSAQERFDGSFTNTPLAEVFSEIERQTDLQFFYLESWVDTLTVKGDFDNVGIEEILDKILDDTRLNFYRLGNKFILSNNSPISGDLPANFLQLEQTESEHENIGYVFSREYQSPSQNSEKSVIEIGRKEKMQLGRSSTVAGVLTDKATDNPITGALVFIEDPPTAATTDASGFYSLNIPNGKHELRVQFVGMENIIQDIVVFSDGTLDLRMSEAVVSLEEIVVVSDRDENVNQVEMGLNRIDLKTVQSAPKILGETDIVRVATTLPGVQTVGEGSSGIYVRGGGVDQNLILLDGAPIYNSSHFLGFFSAFNSDGLESSNLYKSSLPAKYGGRLSSILEINTKDGNEEEFNATGGIGPVTTRLSLSTPIWKERSSLLISGRSTYSKWILKKVPDEDIKNSDANFQDVIAKVNFRATSKDNISVTGYYSRDEFRLTNDSLFSYQNRNLSLNWIHDFNASFSSTFTLYRSEYLYKINFDGVPENRFDFGYDIKESGGKLLFGLFLGEKHDLEFGIEGKQFQINPGSISPTGNESNVTPESIELEKGLESAAFISDNWDLGPKISISAGLRYSMFNALGPGKIFGYLSGLPKSKSTIIDTVNYTGTGSIKTYHGPEARISTRFSLNSTSSLKAGYGNTRQYIHLLSNTNAVSPTDTWKLSDTYIQPQTAHQFSIGYYRNFPGYGLETSVETYFKSFSNILDYKIGAELLLNEALEADVLSGKGHSYGIELFIKKRTGKLNGWLSYTFSRSFLKLNSPFQTERVNDGKYFPTNFDKPHNVNLIANYKLTRRYSFSTNFSYSKGRPITFPVGQYDLRQVNVIQYSERNKFRIPDYLRLDLAINIEGNHKIRKLAHSYWTFSLYNVFGRDNIYSIYFISEAQRLQGYRLTVFGRIIPSITYNFRF